MIADFLVALAFQRLALQGRLKRVVPERTNWFTLKDLLRYRRQSGIRVSAVPECEAEAATAAIQSD